MPTYLRRREAAEALGISRQALEKHIKAGRIEETEQGIDIEKARAAHAAIRAAAPLPAKLVQPQASDATEPPAPEPPAARKAYAVPRGAIKATADASDTERDTGGPSAGSIFDLTAARARKEHWNAERARQAYDIARGNLIPRDVVERKEATVARTFRDQMLSFKGDLLPKLPPHLRGEVDARLDQFLADLQQACARIAEESTPQSA